MKNKTAITYIYNIYSLQFLLKTNLRLVSLADVPSTSPTDTLPIKEIVIKLIYYSFMLNVSLHRCLLHEVTKEIPTKGRGTFLKGLSVLTGNIVNSITIYGLVTEIKNVMM